MKTSELIREIGKAAKARGLTFELLREGAAHQLFRCGTVTVAIPRHREVGPKMAFEIRKQLEPVLGERWWR